MSDEEEQERSLAQAFARKKHVRGGHRASVTRTIYQVNEALESRDLCKLKQLEQFLTEKSRILTKLDNELMEMISEDHLEDEIVQADKIQEELSLAIISVQEALQTKAKKAKGGCSSRHQSTRSLATAGTSTSDNSSSSDSSDHEQGNPGTFESALFPTLTTQENSTQPASSSATSVSETSTTPASSTAASVSGASATSSTALLPAATSTDPVSEASAVAASTSHSPVVSHSVSASSTASRSGASLSTGVAHGGVSLSGTLPGHPPRSTFGMSLPYHMSGMPLPRPPSGMTMTHPSMYATSGPYPFYGLPHSGILPTTSYSVPLAPLGGPVAASSVASHAGPVPPHMSYPPHPSMAPHTTHHVKLPKLSIGRFNGDLTKWVTFWDSFSSSIHFNSTLSNVDKFNYLVSLVESSAAEAIAGLSITSANYEEAISILKKRFGNTQLIVNQHMESMLGLSPISSHHDTRGLRRLYDKVESHVRGLRSLGVPTASYGSVVTSVLVNKLPPEIKLIVTREMTGEQWGLERVMEIFEHEVGARERAAASNSHNLQRKMPPRTPTANALVAGTANAGITCTYCNQSHRSASCNVIADVSARKEALRRAGRCFICLRKNHLSRECRSNLSCKKCRGRHHVSICSRHTSGHGSPKDEPTRTQTPSSRDNSQGPTNAMYAGTQSPVLLQTARLQLLNLNSESQEAVARAIMDTGSQRTFITRQLRDMLHLPTVHTEKLHIKTFGSSESHDTVCDVVRLGLVTDDAVLTMTALVVPHICNPITAQPIRHSKENYSHLLELDLADSADTSDTLEIDVLIGSDLYWELVTGRVVRGERGPTAIHTKVGWVLSGPINNKDVSVNLTLTSSHTLKVDTYSAEPSLDDRLKLFWELDSLGVMRDESSVYERFVQQIRFKDQRYEVSLPWKEHHPPLLDHYELSRGRLSSLLRRLRRTPDLLAEYNSIIQEQLSKGIVELVSQPSCTVSDRLHYLPHHGVVRQDKATSKLRIVFDASARSSGPSLNDCLYTGPKFCQSIFDILLRFRLKRVALTGDIEKAFLMVSVVESDRDSLRFLWASDPSAENPRLITIRFTRVVFGVSASPFLLNATINHHLETYRDTDPLFVDKFLSSIYVDDLVTGSDDVESTFELYVKSKLRLAVAGFKLRKFITNSDELRYRIQKNEENGDKFVPSGAEIAYGDMKPEVSPHAEEDQSYAQSTLGGGAEKPGVSKVLGVEWNATLDEFQFNISEVVSVMESLDPTKRSLVSVTAKFFDPLGVVSPVTITFKMFCQELCEAKLEWNKPLTGHFLSKWNRLLEMLKGATTITVPRCLLSQLHLPIQSAELIGFCDASAKAYAAVVYLRIQNEAGVDVQFVAAKTKVAPVGGATIPRLELLSALLLSKLLDNVSKAITPEISLCEPICFTDSKSALYWIQGTQHEWKQFVENRVTTIRGLISPQYWRHCPGKENPADIPSRGVKASALADSSTWLHGPAWLRCEKPPTEGADCNDQDVPDLCRVEMKGKPVHSVIAACAMSERSQLFDMKRYSSLHHLFKITALVMKFIRLLRDRVHKSEPSTTSELECARIYWIKISQSKLQTSKNFTTWEAQLGLFQDENGVWRCGGRMSNSCLNAAAKNPILLDKKHPLASMVVWDAHRRVMHGGVRETLSELRATYWLIRGRQFVRKLLHKCVICRKFEGRPCRGVPAASLPDFRVQPSRPFQSTGVDFAGPLFVRSVGESGTSKVWLCRYTCCSTRAVHLELVQDMSAETFLRSFRRFAARRGTPLRIISDNAKTFKSASAKIAEILNSHEVEGHLTSLQIEWDFNLEKAPWWGGIFERMIKSAKRCLRKSIGRNSLTFDELLTLVIEVEAVLNSRPLTYVSSEDLVEPLTPSHLLVGYRILTLPDSAVPEDDSEFTSSPEGLTRRMRHLVNSLQHFWKRWKKEYLLELREHHRMKLTRGEAHTLEVGEVVTVYDEGHPRGLWRLGKIEELLPGVDGQVRGVRVKVISKKGRPKVLRRPIQHIYPLEVRHEADPATVEPTPNSSVPDAEEDTTSEEAGRPRRLAALNAREIVRALAENEAL